MSRFREAHGKDYKKALSEVKAGHKSSHWMWYIFPQILGLGMSRTSVFYAIADRGEAKAYMQDLLLGAHMIELCEALLTLETNDAMEVFGKVLEKFFDGERDEKTLKLI